MCQEKKRRGKLTRGVLHLQYNAPAHTSQDHMAAATKCSFEVLPHPPYSPDLVPSNFCLFPNLKTNNRGRNFGSNQSIIDEHLGDQDEGFYFERDKQTGKALEKVHRGKGRLYLEIMAHFLLLVISKVQGPRTFFIVPRTFGTSC